MSQQGHSLILYKKYFQTKTENREYLKRDSAKIKDFEHKLTEQSEDVAIIKDNLQA